jgi:hypothetical protein
MHWTKKLREENQPVSSYSICHKRSTVLLMGIQSTEQQLLLKFTAEPLHHTHLQEPPYCRVPSPDDPVDKFPSPREAFQNLVNPLLEQGFSEEQIHPRLHTFMCKQRWFLLQLLKRIEAGRGTDAIQRDYAFAYHKVFDDLTEFEHAWHTFELNITPLKDSTNVPVYCRNLALWFHGRMGGFRRDMPEIFDKLST